MMDDGIFALVIYSVLTKLMFLKSMKKLKFIAVFVCLNIVIKLYLSRTDTFSSLFYVILHKPLCNVF